MSALLQRFWDLRIGHEEVLTSSLFPVVISIGLYALTVLPLTFFELISYKYPWWQRLKLHTERPITWPMVRKCLAHVLTNNLLYVTPVTIAQYIWIPPTKLPSRAPSVGEYLGQLCVMLVVFDFQYWLWHVAHHKSRWLYKNFHSVHHQYSITFALVGQYLHPWELFTLGLFTTVGPWFFKTHPLTTWTFMLVNVWLSTDAHSGLDLPFNLDKLIPFDLYGGSRKHDMHHMKPLTNYQPYFSTWDRLFGWECPGMVAGGQKPPELLEFERRNRHRRLAKDAEQLMKGTVNGFLSAENWGDDWGKEE